MTDADKLKEGQLILYQTPEGAIRVEVLYESETFWLSQKKMAELFGVEIPTLSYHLKEVYDSGELSREATLRKFRTVQQQGRREVSREFEFYNLNAIISVGYRVNSVQVTRLHLGDANPPGIRDQGVRARRRTSEIEQTVRQGLL